MSDFSITSASSSTQQTQWSQRRSEFRQQFEALGKALQSGDLEAARKAFDALKQMEAPANGARMPESGNSSRQSGFEALGQALQSGDLNAARQAFAHIQQAGGHHHHHARPKNDHDADDAGGSAATASPANAGSSGVNLTA